jgi:short subunit dehydrogenase-like uncharacterized protein
MAAQETTFIIYGATGYTGRLACQHAKSIGIKFVIAGRSEDKLKELAALLQVSYRVFDVDNVLLVREALRNCQVLLNCAGPFMHTAKALISECIHNKVHYLDIAAELDSYRLAEAQDDEAQRAGVMLLPGCGGSVAMLGCLAGHAVKRAASPAVSIDIALHVSGSMSRGSAISAMENLTTECLERRQGKLAVVEDTYPMQADFKDGRGVVSCIPVTLPDLITIGRATDVGNIRTYVNVSGDAFPSGDVHDIPDGPTTEERESNPYQTAVIVRSKDGSVTRSVLHTVNGYSFTPIASVEAARLVLGGKSRSGFQTPAGVFGNDFVKSISGSKVLDL